MGQVRDSTCELIGFINDLQDEGRSVIIATPDLDFALTHCTHLIALPDQHTQSPDISLRTPPPAEAEQKDAGAGKESVRVPPARPRRGRGLMSALNPMTLFVASMPLMVCPIALHSPGFSVTVLTLSTLLMIAARAPWKRTVVTVAGLWTLVAMMFLVFRYGCGNRAHPNAGCSRGVNPLTVSLGLVVSLVGLSPGSGVTQTALVIVLSTAPQAGGALSTGGWLGVWGVGACS